MDKILTDKFVNCVNELKDFESVHSVAQAEGWGLNLIRCGIKSKELIWIVGIEVE